MSIKSCTLRHTISGANFSCAYPGPQHAELKEMIQQAVTAAMLNLVESGAIAMPPASPQRASTASPLDGVEFDEDSLFGDLLENQAQVA